ncbi:MAG TPA: MBL fold metallo-hydrolase [Burkholderiaceae bacterium]|jgi:flavorubredoxin|nr:MBL fold metallo-hydrolase [Burkholderiaceae bacterium]
MSTIDEVADGIFRIHTPVSPTVTPGGFSYNQYLVLDDEPLLFHTGMRRSFDEVASAIARVVPLARLRHLAFSHWEQDECGALDGFLARAPHAVPICSRINVMINRDGISRTPRAMEDGEPLVLGKHRVRWFETPHLPHGWESGLLLEETTGTFFCGDLFSQPGTCDKPLVESDIFGPSEALRAKLDYFAHGRDQRAQIERLAASSPQVLACMHGHAWAGDGAALLRELAATV